MGKSFLGINGLKKLLESRLRDALDLHALLGLLALQAVLALLSSLTSFVLLELGTGDGNTTDEFSEKIQTAFDTPHPTPTHPTRPLLALLALH